MKKYLALLILLALLPGCRQESLGPLNGILVVYSPSLAEFIDTGGLEQLHLVVETVDPEPVFSFSYAELSEFQGTLKERRMILILLSADQQSEMPGELDLNSEGIYSGRDLWALNQQVFGVVISEDAAIPELLSDSLLEAYNSQMHSYLYKSFVSTTMTSPARMDSLAELGFTLDIPKSYQTFKWSPIDGFAQYQRQPDDECLLLFSISVIPEVADLTAENAMLAREAMARTHFYDAGADSVDRARTTATEITLDGLSGLELTGVWRNPEYLNAGSFTSRVLDAGDQWYILDIEVYNPGYGKEPYLREGWIVMDTFHKE